jgi:hypothetical protein
MHWLPSKPQKVTNFLVMPKIVGEIWGSNKKFDDV